MDGYNIGMRKITPEELLTAQLIIKLHPTGAVSIEGPMGDVDLCLLLANTAVDALKASKTNRQRKILTVPDSDVRSDPLVKVPQNWSK